MVRTVLWAIGLAAVAVSAAAASYLGFVYFVLGPCGVEDTGDSSGLGTGSRSLCV